MLAKLTDIRMHDGSRHFVSLPESVTPPRLLRHIFGLRFAIPYFYLPGAIEVWIDFWYQGNRFTINNQFGEYWLFVKNPKCNDAVLEQVANHFERLLAGAGS
jgi:hypothetical protein